MLKVLCITIRFIQPFPLFHGRTDTGSPEWPPSPLRLFQAIVNAACLRQRGVPLSKQVANALCQLESINPTIVAPVAHASYVGYRAYVPHNQGDLVTAAWERGNNEASIASHRVEKDIRPMRLENESDDIPELHYLFPIDASVCNAETLLEIMRPIVRSVTALGWGIDLVVADATLLSESNSKAIVGDRWEPSNSGRRMIRVQRPGTLDALTSRHQSFLQRIIQANFTPVSPLRAFQTVRYRRCVDSASRPYAVFKLLDENRETARYPHAQLIHIAGMVRHIAIDEMKIDPPHWRSNETTPTESFFSGHREENDVHYQMSYVPLPSIGNAHADAMIRNVMLIAPISFERELEWLCERIDGARLTPEVNVNEQSELRIERFKPPARKFIDLLYLGESRNWQSVTPVVLDGHDDKKPAKTTKLIQLALSRAGIETPCEFTWQSFPYVRNCLSAHKYDRDGRHTGYHRPQHLKHQTAVHVRLTFEHPVTGPLTLGAGRHCGFGLMAAIPYADHEDRAD
jgi:CRISPR-associated protein Csb2